MKTGIWVDTTSRAYLGSYGRSNTAGLSTIYFTGTRLDWIAMKARHRIAVVYPTGEETTINLARARPATL